MSDDMLWQLCMDEQSRILMQLGIVWAQHPEWRLGQLICNVAGGGSPTDPFYTTDEKMLAMLKEITNS